MRFFFALCALVMIMPIDATTIQPIAVPAAYQGSYGGKSLLDTTFPATDLPGTIVLRKGMTSYTAGGAAQTVTAFDVYTPVNALDWTKRTFTNLLNVTPSTHTIKTIARARVTGTDNVICTATFNEAHGFQVGDKLFVKNTATTGDTFNGPAFNSTPGFVVLTVPDDYTVTYSQTYVQTEGVGDLADDATATAGVGTINTVSYIGEGFARWTEETWARLLGTTTVAYDAVSGRDETGTWTDYTYSGSTVSCRRSIVAASTVTYTVSGTSISYQYLGLRNSGGVKVEISQGATPIAAEYYSVPLHSTGGYRWLNMWALWNGDVATLEQTATLATGLEDDEYTVVLTLLDPVVNTFVDANGVTITEPAAGRWYDRGMTGFGVTAGTPGTDTFADPPSAQVRFTGTGNKEYAAYWRKDATTPFYARSGTHGYEKLKYADTVGGEEYDHITIVDADGVALAGPAWADAVEGDQWTSTQFTVTQRTKLYFDNRTDAFADMVYTQVFTNAGYTCTVSRTLTAAAYHQKEFIGNLHVLNRATQLNTNTDTAAGGGFDNYFIDNQASYILPHVGGGANGLSTILPAAAGAVAWNDDWALSCYLTDYAVVQSNYADMDVQLVAARTDLTDKYYNRVNVTDGQAVIGDTLTYTVSYRTYRLTTDAGAVLLDLDALLLSPDAGDVRATLRSDVYLRLMMPETGNDRLPAATVDNALAKAYRQFALDTRCFTRDVRLPVVDGALRYQLPADVIEPNGDYVLLNSRPLQELSASDLMYASSTWATDTTASLPFTFYRDRTGAFHLYPTPVGLTATATLTIACDIIPSTLIDAGCIPLMSATQGPLISAAYTDALPAYAAWWLATYALKDDEYPASIAQDALADYKELVSACIGANRGYLV